MSPKLFAKIRKLFKQLDAEDAFNAQGDNGQDIRDREMIYAKRLEQILKEAKK